MAKEKAPQVLADEGAQALDNDTTGTPDVQDGKTFEQRVFDDMWEKSQAFANGTSTISWAELAFVSYEDYEDGRWWWAIGYPESVDPDWYTKMSEMGLQVAVSDHNGDAWPNGDPKKEHLHYLFKFAGKKSFKQFKKLCELFHLVRPERVETPVGAIRYLLHLDIQPDKRPEDRGKVRYDRSHLVVVGGLDIETYLKATSEQISRVKVELYSLVREGNFTSFDQFIDYICIEKPEYTFAIADTRVTSDLWRYIYSRNKRLNPLSVAEGIGIYLQFYEVEGNTYYLDEAKRLMGM